jgi:hypothetical protein
MIIYAIKKKKDNEIKFLEKLTKETRVTSDEYVPMT